MVGVLLLAGCMGALYRQRTEQGADGAPPTTAMLDRWNAAR